MAERRMFARSIIGSARFLRMPPTSRLLYYDLGMEADDDGCVEAFTVMRKTGAAEDDLRVLVSKGFVKILNDDLVSVIMDWKINNYIQKDRYHPSIYAQLLHNPPFDTECIQYVYNLDTQAREVKGREEKGRKDECTAADKPPAPARKKYGSFGWVKLTDEEHSRLVAELGEQEAQRCIDYIDEAAQSTGNKNKWKDWNLVIRKCHRDGWGLSKSGPARGGTPIPDYGGAEKWSL